MDPSKAGDLMEVDGDNVTACPLNCEALDMALDEVIKSFQTKDQRTSITGTPTTHVVGKPIRFGTKAPAWRQKNAAKGSASGGMQKQVLSTTKTRTMKKRSVQATPRGGMRVPWRSFKTKEQYASKQISRFQSGGSRRLGQQGGMANKVFVNRHSYVIVAKAHSNIKHVRSHQSAHQNRLNSRWNAWKSPVGQGSNQKNRQARFGRMSQHQTAEYGGGWHASKQESFSHRQGRTRWNSGDRRDGHYSLPGDNIGLYQPPHRRDEKLNREQGGAVDFGWSNGRRRNGNANGNGNGYFGQRNSFRSPNQGRKSFGGF